MKYFFTATCFLFLPFAAGGSKGVEVSQKGWTGVDFYAEINEMKLDSKDFHVRAQGRRLELQAERAGAKAVLTVQLKNRDQWRLELKGVATSPKGIVIGRQKLAAGVQEGVSEALAELMVHPSNVRKKRRVGRKKYIVLDGMVREETRRRGRLLVKGLEENEIKIWAGKAVLPHQVSTAKDGQFYLFFTAPKKGKIVVHYGGKRVLRR